MAFEWVAGLFETENQQTRGLSGTNAGTVALDDSNPYYNYRLRRHTAEGDFSADPTLLWHTSASMKRRTGLGIHVAAEVGDGTAAYSDVLIILSAEDEGRLSPAWYEDCVGVLQQEFDSFCKREGFKRHHIDRPLGVRFLVDGSEEMGGQKLQLRSGEFVTGLLPNLYSGPVETSHPVVGIHLNLPGVWEGYREIGRLYNDQVLFTIGNHWLDNFAHPSLEQAALYRLRQYPDGSFVHIINPDLQDQYQVTSTNQDGASVLTLATRSGTPLAFMVLAVIDAPEGRVAPPKTGHSGNIPAISPPELGSRPPTGDEVGATTIIPDAPSERIFTLQERGALLQKVHFSAFMLGYDVYLGDRGELDTHMENPAATFQVRKRFVSLIAHREGVVVGGRPVPPGLEVPIVGDMRIDLSGERFEYRDLRDVKVDDWPYVGEIRRPASSTYMLWGEDYQVGRSRECRVVLPDEPRNANIHWKPSVGDGATIRARNGEIPKSRFYTDSIMVASEHGTIDLRAGSPQVICNARQCYIYVRRDEEIMPLYPSTSGREPQKMEVRPGDEVLVGNCLFRVGYTPAGEAAAVAAPSVTWTPEELAADLAANRPSPAASAPDNVDVAPPMMLDDVPPPMMLDDVPPPMMLDDVPPPMMMEEAPPPMMMEEAPPPMMMEEAPPPMMEEVPPPILDGPSLVEPAPPPLLEEPPAPVESAPPPLVEPSGLMMMDDVQEDEVQAPYSSATPTLPGMDAPGDEAPPPLDLGYELPISEEEEEPTMPGLVMPRDVTGHSDEPATEPVVPLEVDDLELPPTEVDDSPPLAALQPQLTAVPSNSAPPASGGEVVVTDDSDAQFELGRPMHVVLAGWTLNGEAVCGNHLQSPMCLPENRIEPDQVFAPLDYFRLKVRGRKGTLTILAHEEVLIDGGVPEDVYTDPDKRKIEIIRRDDAGEEDFVVGFTLEHDRALPDPRARFLKMDHSDPLSAALVTRGLPLNQVRHVVLGSLPLNMRFDGTNITVTDYLDGYQVEGGYRPFFIQRAGGRFKTAPEDGSSFELSSGDRLVVDNSVFVLRAE